MSCDKLVFDLSQEIEGSPNVFVKKDWLNILDNMNTNYSGNQSVVDTSQLSNSNKYLSYREAYLEIPMVLCITQTANSANFLPNTIASNGILSLKSWFGNIIHSFTLDYNGTTICQQTPYINMWNCFKLLTSLSWNDVITQGSTIGFYPDNPQSVVYQTNIGPYGIGVCNNANGGYILNPVAPTAAIPAGITQNVNTVYNTQVGNQAVYKRSQYISYDPLEPMVAVGANMSTYAALFDANSCRNVWKSYIFNKIDGVNGGGGAFGICQIAIMATVYLKHLHSFFSMAPLLKGVFMKMTMNLNNSSCTVTSAKVGDAVSATNYATALTSLTTSAINVPVGGVLPFMVAAGSAFSSGCFLGTGSYSVSLSVGSTVLAKIAGPAYGESLLSKSIYLYVPAYTFNPVFEQSYLSSPIKQVKYTDVYQYQVKNIVGGTQFNNLLTNGIANIKSVLIIPLLTSTVVGDINGTGTGFPEFQSPFDPAGCGTTAPLALLGNFNVVISGQNAIYNTQRYAFEEFNNQLYGQNAVNGGMTDGLTSSLIDSLGFETNYCYYYVNVSRMLPIEESVPKSVQIIGTNFSLKTLDFWCFIEYGVDVSIDILTGSRV